MRLVHALLSGLDASQQIRNIPPGTTNPFYFIKSGRNILPEIDSFKCSHRFKLSIIIRHTAHIPLLDETTGINPSSITFYWQAQHSPLRCLFHAPFLCDRVSASRLNLLLLHILHQASYGAPIPPFNSPFCQGA